MSTIKVQNIQHTSSSTNAIALASDGTCIANITNNLSNRNKVKNGAMVISQRGSQETGIDDSYTGYRAGPDLFKIEGSSFGTHTVSKSTDSPNGFANSLKVDCTTANTSLSAGSYFEYVHKFEGQDLQDFAKGTSDAKQYAVSFNVKTTKTGTYVVVLQDEDNTRICSKTYTVSNTNWNRYELIFPADTTGAFVNDNNASLSVRFVLVAGTTYSSGTLQTTWASTVNANTRVGQVNFADSTSNEWYLTGVQLEVSDYCTSFEHEPYSTTLLKCQRYYHVLLDNTGGIAENTDFGIGLYYISTYLMVPYKISPEMRATPTLDCTSSSNLYRFYRGGGYDSLDDFTFNNGTPRFVRLVNSSDASGTAGQSGILHIATTTNAKIALKAEL